MGGWKTDVGDLEPSAWNERHYSQTSYVFHLFRIFYFWGNYFLYIIAWFLIYPFVSRVLNFQNLWKINQKN